MHLFTNQCLYQYTLHLNAHSYTYKMNLILYNWDLLNIQSNKVNTKSVYPKFILM